MTDNLITISKSAYESLQQELIELRQMSVRNQCTKSSANPEHISLFIEHAPAAIAILDQQMRYLLTSRRWRQDYALGDREIIGYSHYELFPNIPQSWREIHQRCLAGAIEKGEEDSFPRADGSVDWVKWEIHPWYTNSGKIGGIIMFTEVITHRKQAEIALANSERFLKDIADNLLVGAIFQIAYFNGVWRVDYVSDFIWQLAGITAAEIMEDFDSFVARIHPEDLDSYVASVTGLLANLAPWHYEGRLIKPNGEIRWWQADSTPTKNQQGEIIFRGVLMDISERKQAEQALKRLNEELEAKVEERTAALRQSEARFQKLADNVPGMLFEFCLHPNGAISFPYVSSGAKEITELEPEQIQADGENFIFTYTQPDNLVGLQAAIVQSAQTLENFEYEWGLTTPSGQEKWIQAISRPERQPGGEIIWYGCMIDISDRQQVEKERQMYVSLLRQSEARFQKLADSVPGMLYEFCLHPDGAMSFLYVSSGSREILGLAPEQMQADATLGFAQVHPDDVSGLYEATIKSGETLETFRYQWRITTPCGQEKWIECVARPELQPGGKIIWYACMIDISDRQQVEKERQMYVSLLRQSEARFQKLADNVPGMLYEFCLHPDGSTSLPYASSGLRDIVGVQLEQVQTDAATSIFAYTHADDFDGLQAAILQSAQTLENFKHEWRFTTPSGQEKWVQAISRPERQPGGEIIWYGCMIDISDRQQVEKERQMYVSLLRQSEARFQKLADNVPGMLYEFRLSPDGAISFPYVSSGVREILELEPEQLQADADLGFGQVHPDDRSGLYAATMRSVQTLQTFKYEWRITTFSGQEKWIQALARPERQAGGEIISYGCMIDVSDRQQAQQQLQEQAQFLQSIWEGVDYGIYVLDVLDEGAEFRYVKFNPAMLKAGAMPLEPFVGKTVAEVLPADMAHLYSQYYRKCVQSGKSIFFEEFFLVNEQETWWSMNVTPLFDSSSKVYQLIVTANDITERKQAEKERQMFTSLIENSSDFIGLADLQGKPLFLNEAGRKLVGLENVKFSKDFTIDQFFFPEDREDTQQRIYPAVIKNGMWKGEYRFRHFQTQEPIPIDYNVFTIKHHETGEPLCMATITRDIRDRKQAQAQLQEQEQFLRSIYDGITQLVFVVNVLENGEFRFADCNSVLETTLGVSHEYVVGKTPIEWLGAVEGAKVMQRYQNCVDAGNSITYEECLIFNGKETWWLTTLNPLKNGEGKIYRIVGTTLNITERKQAEESLKASQHFIQRVADSSPNILYIFDIQEQRNVYANQEIMSALGYSLETIQQIGENLLPSIVHPDDMQMIHNNMQTLLTIQDGEIFEFEYRMKMADGEWCWLYTRETPFNRDANGKVKQILGVSTDITARKNAEIKLQQQAENLEQALLELQQTQSHLIQSEKMSSLGNMVAGVAHEINNPVNFIHGNLIPASEYTEDLLRLVELYEQYFPNPPEEIQAEIAAIDLDFIKEDLIKLLQSMRIGTQRIREIVLSLRNFSRLDEAEFKQVNIHEGIDSTLMILHNRLKCKPDHPEIVVIKEYGKLPLVECYPGQLNQVFMNILSNAIDALDEAYPGQQGQITIRTETINSDRIAIKISDNGVGIPQHAISKLFDPFFTTKDVGKGTGLGLSISYQIIVDKHQGKLFCNSAPQQGAEFVIEIPITQSQKYT